MNNNDTRPLMVSIWCITYNHEPYIRQCLEGFVMQKTNFRFEAIVHDDASTDGTAAIVREYAEKYPDIIKPILETENQYSKHDGSLDRIMMESCTGKYIALCEGDDYWIEPLKLQKQVEMLESNIDIGLVHTDCNILYQVDNRVVNNINSKLEDAESIYNQTNPSVVIDNILKKKYLIRTSTVLFRRELLVVAKQMDPMAFSGYFMMGDTQIWIGCLLQKGVSYFPQATSVYRSLNDSACHQKDYIKRLRFELSVAEMHMYYISKYGFLQIEEQKSFKRKYYDYLQRYRVYSPEYKGIILLSPKIEHPNLYYFREIINRMKYSTTSFLVNSYIGSKVYRLYNKIKNKEQAI